MTGEERRKEILRLLRVSSKQLSAGKIAQQLQVSRQIIVQDVALLRAAGYDVLSGARGYTLKEEDSRCSRVFKVFHTPEQAVEELNLIVDYGGRVRDVFIYHKVYGRITAPLQIASRLDAQKYRKSIESGVSQPLSSATAGYHYHTVEADSVEILDMIQEALWEHGFLAPLQENEPVDFRKETGEEPDSKNE